MEIIWVTNKFIEVNADLEEEDIVNRNEFYK